MGNSYSSHQADAASILYEAKIHLPRIITVPKAQTNTFATNVADVNSQRHPMILSRLDDTQFRDYGFDIPEILPWTIFDKETIQEIQFTRDTNKLKSVFRDDMVHFKYQLKVYLSDYFVLVTWKTL